MSTVRNVLGATKKWVENNLYVGGGISPLQKPVYSLKKRFSKLAE